MKKFIGMLIVAMMFMVSCDPAFAGIGGSDDSFEIEPENEKNIKGWWTVTAVSGPSIFYPGISFSVDKIRGELVFFIHNPEPEILKFNYGIGVLDVFNQLAISSMVGFTELTGSFAAYKDNATFTIGQCVVYEEELCAEPGTVVSLTRVDDN